MASGDGWCGLDLDGLCMVDDPKLIQGDESPRGRSVGQSQEEEDLEAQRKRRSVSRERKPDPPRRSKSPEPEVDNKKKSKRGSNKEKQKEPKGEKAKSGSGSFGLPFNLSFTGSKSVTTKRDSTKDKKDAETDVETDDERQARNTTRDVQADVFMISGCEDSQTSADVSNVSSFSLPNPNGRAGGACTSALLKVLYNSNKKTGNDLTFVQVLAKMRKILRSGRYTQVPQLTSAKEMDVSQKFYIVPPNCQGSKRAVLIGINYVGTNGELSGCHNDCLNMKDYIMNVWGFKEENITVLMDDGYHTRPTRANILSAYRDVAYFSKSGDAVFCHYSGHGGRVRDDDWGEEADGYDETLVPVDYSTAGQIRDDDLYTNLACAMPSGSTLVSLMDCCHSATVLDLPYKYRADGNSEFQMDPLSLDGGNAIITAVLCGAVLVILVVMLPIMLSN